MEKITIGVYHALSPRTSQEEERMEAMLKESKRQNINLIFYNNEGISLENKIIEGHIYDHGNWKKVRSLIPEVTINLFPGENENKTKMEDCLKLVTEFTTVSVLNKYGIYKKLIESEDYKQYAIESKKVEDYRDILSFIDSYGQVVFKPIGGRQGLDIHFISKRGNQLYIIKDQDFKKINLEDLKILIDEKLRIESYLVQPYIECKTKAGEPYDFRVHVHRDFEGKWKVIHSYPRIGDKKGIVTTLSRAGRTKDIDVFLLEEFDSEWKNIKEKLYKISIDLCEYIQSFSKEEINEIGVDMSIDTLGNFHTYELNGGPQSTYHEELRMKYVMEYARYRYEKHIEQTMEKDLKYIAGEFLKVEKKLMLGDIEDDKYIGVLSYKNNTHESIFNKAAYHIALERDLKLFVFYPSTIDKEDKTISGQYYENGQYKIRKFPYPDLVIDRLGMRGRESSIDLYEELEGLNFDHRVDNLESLDPTNLIRDKDLRQTMVDYYYIDNSEEVLSLLDRYQSLYINGIDKSLNYKLYLVKDGDNYKLLDMKDKESLTRTELKEKLEERFKTSRLNQARQLVVSPYKDGKNYSIVVNMTRGSGGDWNILRRYAKIGGKNQPVLEARYGSYIGDLEEILNYKFGQRSEQLYESLDSLSYSLSQEICKNLEGRISQASFEYILSEDEELRLVDMDLLTPDIKFFEYEAARNLLSYGEYILEKNK